MEEEEEDEEEERDAKKKEEEMRCTRIDNNTMTVYIETIIGTQMIIHNRIS